MSFLLIPLVTATKFTQKYIDYKVKRICIENSAVGFTQPTEYRHLVSIVFGFSSDPDRQNASTKWMHDGQDDQSRHDSSFCRVVSCVAS